MVQNKEMIWLKAQKFKKIFTGQRGSKKPFFAQGGRGCGRIPD